LLFFQEKVFDLFFIYNNAAEHWISKHLTFGFVCRIDSFAFYCSLLLCVWHALIKKLSNRWILGKKITDYFCFLPPPFLSPTLKIVIIFVFYLLLFFPQPWNLSEDAFMLWIKSILILSLITLCVNCRCFIYLPCSVLFFFSLTRFSFLPFILNNIP